MEAEHLLGVGNELGEGPLWDHRSQLLYWLDIQNALIYRYEPVTGNHKTFGVPTRVTVLGLREKGGFVAGTAEGLGYWDPVTGALDLFADPEAGRPHIRFNDGAVDPLGNFWAGTMNENDPMAPDGALYRLDAKGSVREVAEGFTVSNGIGWSPDRKTMYFTDTFRCVIMAFDYDRSTGAIANRRTFIRVPEGEGSPDGLTVDSQGFVWSAQWGGWQVVRYDPAGQVERRIRLPVANVTSCAFGGQALDQLYITSARAGLREAERKAQPLAGDLFLLRTEVQGQAENTFLG